MTNEELGDKVVQAVGAFVYATGSSPLFDQVESDRQRREQRELLGKLIREIVVEGVRTFMETPVERADPIANAVGSERCA